MTERAYRPGKLLSGRTFRWLLLAPLVPLALWACGAHPLGQPTPEPEAQIDRIYELNPLRQLDLVFVIDNSGSMTEEQANLRRNFPDFMRVLENIMGGLPDTRIAVVSTNMGAGPTAPGRECPVLGDKGAFQVKAGCGLDASKNGFFLTTDGKGAKNFTGDLSTVFSCLASLGNEGCGYEHQLQALRAALAASEPTSNIAITNRGFLRKDAFLGIVILSDEDDCSGEPDASIYKDAVPGQSGSLRCTLVGHVCNDKPIPASKDFKTTLGACKPYERQAGEKQTHLINVQEFVSFIKGLKGGNEDKIIVSSIIGWNENPQTPYGLSERRLDGGGTELELSPVCSLAQTGTAAPALRLSQFTKSFKYNTVDTICQADLADAMKKIGEKMAYAINPSCLSATLVDTDLTKSGVQADCQVRDLIPNGTGGYTQQALPGCDSGSPPCWELMKDSQCNGAFRTVVRRPNNAMPPVDAKQIVQCLTCTEATDPARCRNM
jgi:hypothetical protein